jgi:tRNA(Arg) A34 adenosine deaminase TadA
MADVAEIRLPAWVAALAVPTAPANDEACTRLAISLAAENVARGTGGPFGACLRHDTTGEIIGLGVNLAMTGGNPVLHAETVAISLAGKRLAEPGGVTLFTSCEPCIMCLGAAHWAQVNRIVSAALKADAEAVGFIEGAGTPQLRAQMSARGVIFEDGMLRGDGAAVLRRYAGQGGAIYGPKS